MVSLKFVIQATKTILRPKKVTAASLWRFLKLFNWLVYLQIVTVNSPPKLAVLHSFKKIVKPCNAIGVISLWQYTIQQQIVQNTFDSNQITSRKSVPQKTSKSITCQFFRLFSNDQETNTNTDFSIS